MKLIKKGSENADFGKHLACKGQGLGKGLGGCGALLHVVPADIEVKTYVDYDDQYWFTCPDCGAKTYISPNAFN